MVGFGISGVEPSGSATRELDFFLFLTIVICIPENIPLALFYSTIQFLFVLVSLSPRYETFLRGNANLTCPVIYF
jgi:hypothetical protein